MGNVFARYRVRILAAACLLAASVSASAADTPTITTIAGNGVNNIVGNQGPAASASLGMVFDVTVMPDQRVVVSHGVYGGNLSEIRTDNTINFFSVNGTPYGVPNLNDAEGLTSDANGNIVISDTGNNRMYKVDAAGVTSLIAGGGGPGYGAFGGDGGPAVDSALYGPWGVAKKADGTIYFVDTFNARVRKITPAGVISTIAGTGQSGSTGDGGPAVNATLMLPRGVALDASGNLYIADYAANKVRKIGTDGKISTFAGTGEAGDAGDFGPATSAKLHCPADVAVHPDGSVWIVDECNSRIKRVGTDGIIRNMVGTGVAGYNGDNRVPSTAQLNSPQSIFIDASGTKLYICDTFNFRLRLVNLLPFGAPPAPTVGPVAVGNHEAMVAFAAPAWDGGWPITGYTVVSSPAGAIDANAGTMAMTHRMSGLVNGTSYTFTVKATNVLGTGQASAPSAAVVPLGVPGSPSVTNLTLNDHQVTVEFSAPADAGSSPITGYEVIASPAAGLDQQKGSTALSHVVTGLTNGVSYRFTVRATNAVGTGLPSLPSAAIAPAALPAAPGAPQAQAGEHQASLSWNVPTVWGDTFPTGYRVTASPGGATRDVQGSDTTSLVFDGLQNGVSYTFSIRALTPLGLGAAATTNAVVPRPTFTISDASVSEGNSGGKLLTFNIALSSSSTAPISYDLRTVGGSATADVDFVSIPSFRQTIPAGQTSASLAVTINGDATVEPDETFYADAQHLAGAAFARNTATGKIVNDDFVPPVLTISDASVSEGNAGTKVLTFTISLNKPAPMPVSFDLRTIGGNATAGTDYVAVPSFRKTIAAGQSGATLSVTIMGDTTIEPDEVFYVDAQQLANATAGRNTGVGKILNDDVVVPVLSLGDASVTEGNAGTQVLNFPITLSKATTVPVSFNLRTIAGSASAGEDFVSVSSFKQTIAAGQTSATLSVTVNGDTVAEGDEVFYVDAQQLVGVTAGDNVAAGTILNDDVAGPTLSIDDVSVTEGNSLSKQATFTVTLSQALSTDVTYTIATADGSATAPGDYTAKTLSNVTIAAGATSKTFSVSVKGDTVAEATETFTVNLSNVVGATIADGQGVGTITNDDGTGFSAARFDAGGLYDDIDDGQREPRLSTGEYALLLQDAASKLCRRTDGASLVAVDDVENRTVLADLAEATKLACAGKPNYSAVMAEGDSRGFLVAPQVAVLGKPRIDAKAKLSSLQVQGPTGAITLVLPQALPTQASARAAQLHELGARVQATLKSDPHARLVLIGGVTVPGLVDLTQRSLPKDAKLPAERVSISPALLDEVGAAKVEFPAVNGNESQAQVLQLGR